MQFVMTFLLVLLFSINVGAQIDENEKKVDYSFYPFDAMEKGIEGKVYVQFVAQSDGTIIKDSITKRLGLSETLLK